MTQKDKDIVDPFTTQAEQMKAALDRLNDLAEDYCILSASLTLFTKEEKELALKLLKRFLNKYRERELFQLLQQLSLIQSELEFYEQYYLSPEDVEKGEKYWGEKQLIQMKASLNKIPDPWL
ncbi:MAG: hypothetical protein SXA11_19645 [Cyanobacteriota bacterium]|nr:hypothetical protein [Cyanobacteriota bacterium]